MLRKAYKDSQKNKDSQKTKDSHISKLSKIEKYQKERIIQLTELWALHAYMGMTHESVRTNQGQDLRTKISKMSGLLFLIISRKWIVFELESDILFHTTVLNCSFKETLHFFKI